MTGWNMPPGCNVSDIPGNGPAEQAMEAFYDAVFDRFSGAVDEVTLDKIAEWCWKQIGDVYAEGYDRGMVDAASILTPREK